MLLPNPYGDLKMDSEDRSTQKDTSSSAGASSPGHTPGPWKAEFFGSPRVIATDAKGPFPVCDVRGWGHLTGKGHGALGLSHEEGAAIQDANARLIAAAPDLLALARRLDAWWTEEFPSGPDANHEVWGGIGRLSDETLEIWRQVRAAIAKARSLPAI